MAAASGLTGQLDLLRDRRACEHCGTVFWFAVIGRGRPQLFCSDVCRDARVKQQQRDWHRNRRKAKGAHHGNASVN